MYKNHQRGFTIFFAVLVGSLALSIGVSVYELLIRELELAQIAKESQFAIYAADAGAECALYWDSRYNGTESAFAYSSASISTNPTTGITCTALGAGVHDIAQNGWPWADGVNVNIAPALTGTQLPGTWLKWSETFVNNATDDNATTYFLLLLGSAVTAPCAKVSVHKEPATPGSGAPPITTIISRGYNTCMNYGKVRVERAFQVSY